MPTALFALWGNIIVWGDISDFLMFALYSMIATDEANTALCQSLKSVKKTTPSAGYSALLFFNYGLQYLASQLEKFFISA